MTLPVFSEQCYAKMIMHAYKYPYCAVIGLLIGRLEVIVCLKKEKKWSNVTRFQANSDKILVRERYCTVHVQ